MNRTALSLIFGLVLSVSTVSCLWVPEGTVSVEICFNGIDDDGDGRADCFDSECVQEAGCQFLVEICDNGIDDDDNGRTDCTDSSCTTTEHCQFHLEICSNGIDDEDEDTLIDCFDPECADLPFCAGGTCAPQDVFFDGQNPCHEGYDCSFYAEGMATCFEIVGQSSGQYYGACGEDVSCRHGSGCAQEENAQMCLPWCSVEHPACPDDVPCDTELNLGGGVGLCIPFSECSVLAGTGCPAERACYRINPMFPEKLCLIPGTLAAGDACTNTVTCAPGMLCPVFGPTAGTCTPLCDGDFPCATGSCQSSPQLTGAGLCIP